MIKGSSDTIYTYSMIIVLDLVIVNTLDIDEYTSNFNTLRKNMNIIQ